MPVHPSAVVPVTEYVVVEVGETVSVGLTPRELDQLNVVPVISELAVSSVLAPRQISFGVAEAVIVGNG
jgi:predicted signal transduction protein with EAL and GGDEF domain